MLNQSIDAYLQAVRRREAARKRFNEISEIINEVAQRITETQKNMMPGNSRVHHHSFGFGRNGGFVDQGKWPTADAINKAREELHAAAMQVEDAWGAIPDDQRVGLSPPHAVGGAGNG